MKFSYTWLKELSGYNGTPQKLADLLSLHAFETEVVTGTEFPNIIVAKVTKIEKHPNADRVRVITLTDGTNTYYPVVCGAWNFEEDDIVPLALPGATIPHDQHDPHGNPFVLSKAVIRGVESQGMICSGKELGLSDDGGGILKLTEDYKLGETFVAKEGEIHLEISVPANRPDLLGYAGVAREIITLTGSKISLHEPKIRLDKYKPKILKVNITSPKLCSRYTAVRISNIEIGPTPEFIQNRLQQAGHKPINNVVDITNYVMLETGQPLHAFDATKIMGGINVRLAYVNESIKTLDGSLRKLGPSNLVIADSKQPIALAGIMGGENSMIDEFTSEIILESANFDSVSVRKTSRELGLRTDASIRFEKSLPPELSDFAASLAAELFVKYCKAQIVESVTIGSKSSPTRKIAVEPLKINELLGSSTEASEQKRILTRLGFKITGNQDKFSVAVPFFRPDVTTWQDIAEEIGRYKGLDDTDPVPFGVIPSIDMNDPLAALKDEAANILMGLGFSEIYSYSFVSEKEIAAWGIDKKIVLSVSNPQSFEQGFLRPNLLVNMLKTAEFNARHQTNGSYFEISDIYWKEDKDLIQKRYLGMLCFDQDYPVAKLSSAFFALCKRLNVEVVIDQESEQLATVKAGKQIIGRIGHLDVGPLKWVGAHIDFEELVKQIKPKTFLPPIKYPSVERDVAVWARKDLPWAKVEQLVRSMDSNLIRDVELFDIYTGKNAPLGRKSIAFRIVYQTKEKTLTEVEVEKVHSAVLKELKARLNLEVR